MEHTAIHLKKDLKNSTSKKKVVKGYLSVADSISRVSSDPNSQTVRDYLCNKTTSEVKEYIKEATKAIINLYYAMELSILNNGFVSIESGEKVKAIKAIISLCKMALCMPGFNEITLPEEFIDEYTTLLERTNIAIASINSRIKRIAPLDNTQALKNTLERNILILEMLRLHYVYTLGLPEQD